MTMAEHAVPAVAIRRADMSDARRLAAMITGLVAEFSGTPPARPPDPDDGVLACTRRMLALRGAFWALIAEERGEAVGALMIQERASVRAGDVYGKLTELYIAPHRRSRGIGSRLIAEAAALGRERGWTRLEVGRPTTVDSAKAHAVFRRNGFVESDERLRLFL
jgi:GNAT superfamily N-acetyltransferase